MRLLIRGQIKSGKNNMIVLRNGMHIPKSGFVKWRTGVLEQIETQLVAIGGRDIKHPCAIMIRYWWGDLRRRDVPGMMDALWHCFERSKIITDDALFIEVHWLPQGLDRADPRCEVSISKCEATFNN